MSWLEALLVRSVFDQGFGAELNKALLVAGWVEDSEGVSHVGGDAKSKWNGYKVGLLHLGLRDWWK